MVNGLQDTIQWYEDNAEKYAAGIESLASDELIDKFAKYVKPGGKVLDAGCAAGRDSKLLSDKGYKVTGIDLSVNLLKIASTKYPEINFQQANFLKLPFPEKFLRWCLGSCLACSLRDR